MMEAIAGASDEAARVGLARSRKKLVAEATAEGHLNAGHPGVQLREQRLLIVTETYRDVRLVGPAQRHREVRWGYRQLDGRHTGDFSLFRIYAGPDNLPADPARPMFLPSQAQQPAHRPGRGEGG